jgi:hypothetical protein
MHLFRNPCEAIHLLLGDPDLVQEVHVVMSQAFHLTRVEKVGTAWTEGVGGRSVQIVSVNSERFTGRERGEDVQIAILGNGI